MREKKATSILLPFSEFVSSGSSIFSLSEMLTSASFPDKISLSEVVYKSILSVCTEDVSAGAALSEHAERHNIIDNEINNIKIRFI